MRPEDRATVEGLGQVVGPGAALVHADTRSWLRDQPDAFVHAVVTDPPYGLLEYESSHHDKLRKGRGGVWRQPPALDGAVRRPVPRFTVLSDRDRLRMRAFFDALAVDLLRVLVPGGHLFVAANPLLASIPFGAFEQAGFERRASLVRLVQTLRGGDRPKNAHREFPGVTVMPRSGWEPWGLFRKPLEGTVAQNLRRWRTGGLRRISDQEPFRDVILSAPTHAKERAIADHPSLKPQKLLRALVRASLPLGEGVVLDPFAGSGSTVAAAAAVGYAAVGIERDETYFRMALACHGDLRDFSPSGSAPARG